MFSTKRIFKLMAVLAIFLLPAACIGPQPDADAEAQPAAARTVGGGELVGPQWQLTQIATRDGAIVKPADSVLYTLAFGEDGRVAAQISCNRGTGSYETDGNGLTFGMMASTMAACPPDSVADDFVAGLDDARSYAVDGDTLRITTRTGVMTFTSAAAEEEITEEAPAEATAEPVEETAVTGNVTYMVRMALPDGAVITVRLVDISLADAPSELITEQVITTEGQQVPIPFELAYDPTQIVDANTYAVQARIEIDGQLAFISDTIVPVITRDAPTSDVEVMVVPVAAPEEEPTATEEAADDQGTAAEEGATTEEDTASEAETIVPADNELGGVVWQWQGTQMNDDSSTTPADPAAYTLEFAADGRVAVQADCNRGTGPYTLEGNQLTFGAVAVTLMACPEGSQSDAYLQQLGQVGSYFITEDGRLVLELQVDSGSMTFIAAQ